jgi:hypothetical protein
MISTGYCQTPTLKEMFSKNNSMWAHLCWLISIISTQLGACQSSGQSDPFLEFKSKFPAVEKYRWHIDYRIANEETIDVSGKSHIGDTVVYVQASKSTDLDDNIILDLKLSKEYVVGDTVFLTTFDGYESPKYAWKYKASDPDIIFIFGEYLHKYEYGDFNEGQRNYFERNMDSLKRVKGNKLRKLPEAY